MKILLIAAFVLVNFNLVLSQEIVLKSIIIEELETINNEYTLLIDSFLNSEKKCNYFNDSLILIVDFDKTNNNCDTIYLAIESENHKEIGFKLQPKGYYYYCGHLILVFGEYFSDILRKTDQFQKFTFNEIISGFPSKDSIPFIYLDSDIYSLRIYKFINGKFYFFGGKHDCPRE